MSDEIKNILILCTGNSCRSQMAEGFLRKYTNNTVNIFSAGVEVHGLNQRAVQAMAEVGIDISDQTSNHVDEYKNVEPDLVITVCDHANEVCPVIFTSAKRIHKTFPDPAKAVGDEAFITSQFRATRDLIDEYCKALAADLCDSKQTQ